MSERARGRASRGRTRPLYLLLAAGLIALGVAAAVVVSALGGGDGDDDGVRLVTSAEIAWPGGWSVAPLTDSDAAAGVLASAGRSDPDATFLARSVAGRLPADFDIEALADQTVAALETEGGGVEVIEQRFGELGGRDALWITYSQGDARAQMVILPTDSHTFYLVLRAGDADFASVQAEGDNIVQRFVSQIKDAN